MPSDAIVRAPILLATIAWAIGEVFRGRSAQLDRRARLISTAALLLTLLHVVLAFQLVYGWSHEAAVQGTIRQVEALVGQGWRGAIFVNYAFLALWLTDVCWWWVAPISHARAPSRLEAARLAVFTFMFVNGAIVFATGVARLVGIGSVALVLCSALVYSRRRAAA